MRSLLYGLLLIAGVETAALACSCISPGTPEETRPIARQAVQRAAAIVEVDVLSEYRDGEHGGLGEHVRVRRLLWGEAPAEFRIQRREFASSASCDLLLTRGERRLLILYPAARGRFAMQSLCDDFLLSEPGHLAVTLEEARRRDDAAADGERG